MVENMFCVNFALRGKGSPLHRVSSHGMQNTHFGTTETLTFHTSKRAMRPGQEEVEQSQPQTGVPL